MRILTGTHNTGGANAFSYLTKEGNKKWDKKEKEKYRWTKVKVKGVDNLLSLVFANRQLGSLRILCSVFYFIFWCSLFRLCISA